MKTIQKNITTINRYKNGNDPQWIVLHDVGALGQAYANSVYFKSIYREASAHYFVDDYEIWQVVEDGDGAWHVGDDKPNDLHDVGDKINNYNSLGIEMCLNKDWKVTEATKQNTVELVHYLQKKYNIPDARVVRHYDASGKICPLQMSANNWAEWRAFYKRITNKTTIPTVTGAADKKMTTYTVKAGDTLSGVAKQYNTTVAQLLANNNIKNANLIQIGQVLQLTSKAPAKQPVATKSASSEKKKGSNGVPSFKIGDRVQFNGRATHYQTGEAIPASIKKGTYTVMQTKTVAQSNSKTAYLFKEIMSWVLEQDVQKAGTAAAKPAQIAKKKKVLHLPAADSSWAVYNEKGPYTIQHKIATLNPKKFGGLKYDVLAEVMTDVVIIKTSDFGRVAIYVAKGTGATFTYE